MKTIIASDRNRWLRFTSFVLGCTLCLLAKLAPADSAPKSVDFTVERFDVTGPNPLSAAKTDSILSTYAGPLRTLEDLRAAAADLEQAIRDKGFAFYRVLIPAQRIGEGVVELNVIAFQVEEIIVTGNEYHSEQNIRRTLPGLQTGTSPNTRKLQRSLAIANMNPSKQTQAFFSAEKGDALEVRVAAQDQRTKSGLIWANDTGSADTGENRVGAAYQHNNLFDKDHTLTLSFATSPLQAEDVQQYSVSYQVPFYAAGGMASAYAIRSDVNTGQVANFFDVSGRGDFLGGDYTYALPPAGRYKQFLIIGVDDKLFDNDIDFEGQPIGVDVRSRPISVRHNGNWRSEKFSGSTYAGIFVNIESGSHNDDVSYSLTRAGATPSWSAFRAGARLRYEISTWSLIGRVDAQYTDEPLIPGEQFGVGGLNSLRGIDQRQITGDRGFFLSGEVMSPVIGNAGPRLLVFVDVGRVSRIDALPGEVSRDTVASIGAGLRWGWKNRLNVTVDYGYVVDGGDPLSVNPIEEGDSRFHFQVLARI